MKIYYAERFGKLEFTCKRDGYKLSGIVPDSMVNESKAVIDAYVIKRVDETIHLKKEETAREATRAERITNTDAPLSLEHDGQHLGGRITQYKGSSRTALLTISLESPEEFQGSDCIYGSWARAMAGRVRVFDNNGYLEQWAIDECKDVLIRIYETAKKKIIAKKLNDVAEKLNKEN